VRLIGKGRVGNWLGRLCGWFLAHMLPCRTCPACSSKVRRGLGWDVGMRVRCGAHAHILPSISASSLPPSLQVALVDALYRKSLSSTLDIPHTPPPPVILPRRWP